MNIIIFTWVILDILFQVVKFHSLSYQLVSFTVRMFINIVQFINKIFNVLELVVFVNKLIISPFKNFRIFFRAQLRFKFSIWLSNCFSSFLMGFSKCGWFILYTVLLGIAVYRWANILNFDRIKDSSLKAKWNQTFFIVFLFKIHVTFEWYFCFCDNLSRIFGFNFFGRLWLYWRSCCTNDIITVIAIHPHTIVFITKLN